jgi:hypothetical protein
MGDPFVSPLFVVGAILLGLSLTTSVAILIVTIGDSIRLRRR